ncbi:MAG: hypothetical protein AAGE03_01635, partial [Pseudomonadota bacterium]
MGPERQHDWDDVEDMEIELSEEEDDWAPEADLGWDDEGWAEEIEACEQQGSRYPVLRSVAAEEFAELSDEDFAAELAAMTGLDADEVEFSFKSLGRVARRVGGAVVKAAPAMLQGAAAGGQMGMVAGPKGAAVGAAAGAGLALIRGVAGGSRRQPSR